MLIPCVSCGNREYTEESPLWFHCDSCLKQHRKMLKLKYKEDIKAIQQEFELYPCDGCGIEQKMLYLEYVSMWDGYFCQKCVEIEEGMIK
jgi:hypothetical protein